MIALIRAVQEVRRGRHAMRWGFTGDAAVHHEVARYWLGVAYGDLCLGYGCRERVAKAQRLVDDLGLALVRDRGELVNNLFGNYEVSHG